MTRASRLNDDSVVVSVAGCSKTACRQQAGKTRGHMDGRRDRNCANQLPPLNWTDMKGIYRKEKTYDGERVKHLPPSTTAGESILLLSVWSFG